MDILKRKFRGEQREFHIYSQAEADEAGIEHLPWREAGKGGWALSDDGYVGECLDIMGPYPSNRAQDTRYMIFSYGKVFDHPKAKLNFLERKANRSYSCISTKHWATIEANRKRGQRFITAYVMNFMAGVPIDWKKLGLIYRADLEGKKPELTAKNLFSQGVFKEMIQQKMIEVFKGKEITEYDVIDMFKRALAVAEANKDAKEIRKTAEDFRDMFDMNPKPIPRGGEIPPHIEDAEVEELQSDIDQAQIELGQKRLETGETKEE